MASLHHILVWTLIFSVALPVRAELSSGSGARNTSKPSLVILPKPKLKKKRDPNRLVQFPNLKKVQIGKNGNGDGSGEDDSTNSILSDIGDKLFGGKGSAANALTAGVSNRGQGSSTFFDENGKKGDPRVDPGQREDGNGNNKMGPPKGPPVPPDDAQELPFWIPICFFFDPNARSPQEMNQVVKTVVDNYGKCGVAVRPFPYTINPGTYDPNEPESINQGAETKCNANQAFGVEGTAAQTHPNSKEASDRMCRKNWNAKDHGYDTAGCSVLGNKGGGGIKQSTQMGTGNYASAGGGGKPATSICDVEGLDAATHELGHSIGGPGQGGDYLVNDGEGQPGAPKAGEGLQLQGENETIKDAMLAAEGGTGLGGGFTDPGCKSVRGGANVNDRHIVWRPSRQNYYKGAPPASWINLLDGKPLFGPKTPPGNTPPIPPLADRGPGFTGDARPQPPGVQIAQVPQTQAPRGTPPSVQHPKNKSIASGPSKANSKVDQILANSTVSTPETIPQLPEPKLQDPSQLAEPVLPPPPGIQNFSKGGFSKSVTFDESASKLGNPMGGSSGGSSSSSSGSFAGGGQSSVSITFDEGAPKGGGDVLNLPSGSSGSSVSIGRTSRPPVILSGKSGDRSPASVEEEIKKKKGRVQKKREFGDGLRKGSKVPIGDIYEAGGGSSFDSPASSD